MEIFFQIHVLFNVILGRKPTEKDVADHILILRGGYKNLATVLFNSEEYRLAFGDFNSVPGNPACDISCEMSKRFFKDFFSKSLIEFSIEFENFFSWYNNWSVLPDFESMPRRRSFQIHGSSIGIQSSDRKNYRSRFDQIWWVWKKAHERKIFGSAGKFSFLFQTSIPSVKFRFN